MEVRSVDKDGPKPEQATVDETVPERRGADLEVINDKLDMVLKAMGLSYEGK
ncbi:hypothetical protein [Candidatus Collinsella stercoripullorum]|uniref:hypothetical protein n=1 Tax=Candidatus Collinsella stercoripullorum TaxID=2838522 RepID=UPI0022E4BAE6|nr:hypothetical protein [Candidatus Collinsella stercoripullorum]